MHPTGPRGEQVRTTYGSPRVHQALKARGVGCSVNTLAKLMKADGVRSKARRRFVVRTTDITYVPTAESWLYLAVVLDLFSRRVVGWATADHLRAELACDALRMALKHRRPKAELLHHSDRGVQCACESCQALLAERKITPSMSRKGNCHDNAVTESFFSTTKRELTHHESYATREEACRSLFEYIEVFYNRRRLHSTLGYRSPVDYEARFPN
nr:IS3 family transposase [Paludisphaera borealis]